MTGQKKQKWSDSNMLTTVRPSTSVARVVISQSKLWLRRWVVLCMYSIKSRGTRVRRFVKVDIKITYYKKPIARNI